MKTRLSMIGFLGLVGLCLAACGGVEYTTEAAQVTAPPAAATQPPSATACLNTVILEAYDDANLDNKRDPGEAPIAGIDFGLLMPNAPAEKALIAHGKTDANGQVTLSAGSGSCIPPEALIGPISLPDGGYHVRHATQLPVSEVTAGQPVLYAFVIASVTPQPTPTAAAPLGDAAPVLDPFSACDLLTTAEAGQASGTTVTSSDGYAATITGGAGSNYACDYPPMGSISVGVPAPSDNLGVILDFSLAAEHQDVPGLGERAYWLPGSGDLLVVEKNLVVTVRVSDGQKIGTLDTARALAQLILPRIEAMLARSAKPTAPPSAGFTDCDVLSRGQAASILGPLTEDPTPLELIGPDAVRSGVCIFTGGLNRADIANAWYSSAAAAQKHFAQAGGEAVDGVGDQAAWDEGQLTLSVLRDKITLSIIMQSPDNAREMAIRIGQIAVVRIP